jgi:amino acid transporter
MSSPRKKNLGYWEVTAIGIGGMVGGGIFAVLGLSVELTGGGAPIAFLIAGFVALVTAYSYARLSVTCPSQGGTGLHSWIGHSAQAC